MSQYNFHCPRQDDCPPCCQMVCQQPSQIPSDIIDYGTKSMVFGILSLFVIHLLGIVAISCARKQKQALGYMFGQAKAGYIMGIISLAVLLPLDTLIFLL